MCFRTRAFYSPLIHTACRIFRSACLFLCLAAVLPETLAVADAAYLGDLQRLAREKGLEHARTWEVLLHYKPTLFGMVSLVDDPSFFNARTGRKDPSAELEATLASFFQESAKEDEEHPRCKFIARYTWLREELAIDEERLPAASCDRFEKALAEVKPRSVVLVFPNTLLNSPTSMFGHTLLRINTAYDSDLLSHAVNYAAITGENPGPLYALKGLFGFFKGRYSNLPYYQKVQEYSDLEHRDIWEYHLNLTPEETYRVFLHTWEMKDFSESYYFFDRNCSFNILFLIEAGRPSLQLTDEFYGKFRFWVIPVDTVRAAQKYDLVDHIAYRPSRSSKILSISSDMDGRLRDMSFDVVDGVRTPQSMLLENATVEEKRKVLDLSAELTQYRFARHELEREPYLKQFMDILAVRSKLGTPAEDPRPVATPISPDQGHKSGRFQVGGGYRTDSWFTELGWRAAYHDLLDPDAGYSEGAQINFFDVSGRYYFRENRLRLQGLRFIDIVSLSPRTKFFKPVSWKVNTGFDRELFPDGEERLLYRVNPGGGFAYKSEVVGLCYIMMETDLQVSGALKDDYALGLGASAGIFRQMTGLWKLSLSAQSFSYEAGDKHRSTKASLAQNFTIATNNSVTFALSREKTFDQYQSVVKLMWNVYR